MIKIVILTGGIGNQLFQYHLYKYLESKGHIVYYKDETNEHMPHYGLELDKYFDVKIKKMPLPIYIGLRFFWHFFPKKYIATTATDQNYNESLLFFDGYWHDTKFLLPSTVLQFKALPLSDKNKQVLKHIQDTESVCLHVRRGDYLLPKTIGVFGNICTKEYYDNAIDIIRKQISNPYFYIFSDDIDWCKENFNLDKAEYIDWNKDTDSIYDMYLMSHCKANIIANSTFSYWAAKISKNNCIVYPKKWFANMPAPNMFPQEWIGI